MNYAEALARDDAPLRGRAVVVAEYRDGVRAAWAGTVTEMQELLDRIGGRRDLLRSRGFYGLMVKGARVL